MSINEMTILVVDDEQVNVLLLQAMLEKNGYRVLTANNGQLAREIAAAEMPALILLDVMMPGEDGFETCKNLKRNAITADIPIIFISALNDTENRVKGLTLGGLDYIGKPFQKEEVLARVKNYLKLRHAYLRVIEEQSKRLQQIQEAQQAILVKPEELPGTDFGIYYVPVLEAGGDFYDVFEISAGVYGYFVADISGHDLGASFATSALKALIRQNSSPLYTPDETIRMINSILISIFAGGQHLTAVYACLDQYNSTFYMVNAAHVPVLVIPPQGEPCWLEANGDVIGVFENAVFECRNINVVGGERIYIFSDGLLETIQGKYRNREEGMLQLLESALSTREQDIQTATENIVSLMFENERKPEDDVLLLGIDV